MNVKNCNRGTACTLGNIYSADDILKYLSYFSEKTGFDISCKFSPLETICMKCLILFFFFFLEKLEKLNEFVVCGNCHESGKS